MNNKAEVDLSKFDNSWYHVGGRLKLITWYVANLIFIKNRFVTSSSFKSLILRAWGGAIGKNVTIKPGVNIKFPWMLAIGSNCWIGEGVWIDNIAPVKIEDNVCISQGAMLLCGNHNYKKQSFDLIVGDIVLEKGAWVGAKAVVCPGVTMHTHSVLTVGSVATKDLEAFAIYSGVPAKKVRERRID